MTTPTMTVYDPEGTPFLMEWSSELDYDMVNWCAFCDETITAGWFWEYDDDVMILCQGCAAANATTEGREIGNLLDVG